MNYLAKIQELKRIEEEKRAKLARIADDKARNYDAYLSNLTYMQFERFIMRTIPLALKAGISKSEFNNKTQFDLKVLDYKGESEIVCDYHCYSKVNKDEFLKYIREIPGHISSTLKNKNSDCVYTEEFYLDELALYYYEKMQELEHFNIDYNDGKLKR